MQRTGQRGRISYSKTREDMKTLYSILGASAALLMFFSCEKTNVSIPDGQSELCDAFKLSAVITRTTLDASNMSVNWQDGDCIYAVTTDKAWGADAADDAAGSSIAEYVLSGSVFSTDKPIAAGEHEFHFLYGTDKLNHRGAGTTVTLGNQTLDCSAPTANVKSYDVLCGKAVVTIPASVASVDMKHVYALMKVTVTNSTGAALTLSSLSFSAAAATIAGKDAVTFGSAPTLALQSGGSDSIVVTLTNGAIASGAEQVVYIVTRPLTSYTGPLTLCATDSEGKTYTSEKAVTDLTLAAGSYNPCSLTLTAADPTGGFDMAKHNLYIAGTAQEAGQVLNPIHLISNSPDNKTGNEDQFKGKMGNPEFEAFTDLKAGQVLSLSYGESPLAPAGYFDISAATDNNVADIVLSDSVPAGGFTVANDGVYRVRVNVSEAKVLIQKLKSTFIRTFSVSWNGSKWANVDVPISYVSGGVFKASGIDMKWGGDAWAARNDTYRFSFVFEDQGKTQQYGASHYPASATANPTSETDASYWVVKMNEGGATTEKGAFKWPIEYLDETENPKYTADVTLYMNFSQGNYYYHTITNRTAK